ncbi:hypothetical protein MLD38_008882 [Melastoma candidum]|uniref:Uncharacterized protein n=1 Tax=Melastoma candidum TaxID=119954 RepID=A0ACB9RV80_9MYRT|nr:hypothetical protein MLD38_008882 [Melastoma candidum]
MDRDDDFTFCQVAPSSEQGGLPSTRLAHGIDGMSLADDSSAAFGGARNGRPLWKDKLEDGSVSSQQAIVGSLSFNVINASSATRVSNSPKATTFVDGKVPVPQLDDNKSSSRKASPRAKVPFEKGYSQMDWLKLTRTHPDLAGLKGASNRRLISMDEVRQHQMEGSMWTVLKGRVYNISPYMKFHPGGVDILSKAVGKDCTSLFNKYHAWVNAEFLLEKCLVGVLDDSKK